MKICILTPRFPLPECGGDLLRINNIARYLKGRGHSLVLVSYTEEEPDLELASGLYDNIYTVRRSHCSSVFFSALFLLRGLPIQCGYYYSRSYLRLLRSVIEREKPDLFVSHLIRMVPFVEALGLEERTIVEMTDALSKSYALATDASGSLTKRLLYPIEKNLSCRYEQRVARRYGKVVLVSQPDIDFINARLSSPAPSLTLHTNGVACPPAPATLSYDARKICFIGHMQSLQNQDAVFHFVNDIFPLILRRCPDARFYVVGAHPPKSIQRLDNGGNIRVTGFVSDLNAFVSDAAVAVAPVRIAAGIQNKVLVAMANSVPVVLSSLISKSIPEIVSGENSLVCDDEELFAAHCADLMTDASKRNAIAAAGYRMVADNYSWESKLNGYELTR